MDLQAENERLRAELEAYRQRELEDLRSRLAEAEQRMEHYRQEAQRNAEIGRQIASEYQTENTKLRTELASIKEAQASVKRFGR